MTRAIRAAWGFLTIFPGGKGDPAALPSAYAAFPLVGLLLGAVLAGVALVLRRAEWSPVLAGALVTVLGVVMTGGLHLDALADAADGFYAGRSPDEVVRLMRDPHVGAMGIIAITCAVMMKWAAITSLLSAGALVPLVVIPAMSRWGMVVMASTLPRRKAKRGTAGALDGPARRWNLVVATVTMGVVVAVLWQPWSAWMGASLMALLAGCRFFVRRRLGRATGDVIGAVGELGETMGFVVAAGMG